MLDATTLVAFAFASFVLAIVPGPSVTLIVATSLQRGVLGGMATVAGTSIGILSMVFVVAFGFETLLGFMGWAFDWIKIAGALYLIYLGFNMLRSSGKLEENVKVAPESLFRQALRGFIVMWANPKTLLFFGAFIPQFVSSGEPAFLSLMQLGLIFFVVATISDSIYAVLAASLGQVLSGARVRILSRISGAFLMLGGVWLATQQKA
ncbi:MAG TPA: LysE family translocator [Devosia sp.]|nr:LysE family translocator [Devosia sp.]